MNLALSFFLLKRKLHYCFTEFILLLFPLCIIAYFISWKLINTQKAKNHWVLLYFITYFEYIDNTWHMLFRNYISQKDFFTSFSQWALKSRWEPFFFFLRKRNKYKKISTSTQWGYSGFTLLYYRINSAQRFYNH